MFSVVDAAVTESPTARFTATTVPSIGLAIVAWARACWAAVTASVAASTAVWYDTRSAADGEDVAEVERLNPPELALAAPDPDDPDVRPVPPVGVLVAGAVAGSVVVGRVVVGGVGVGAGGTAAKRWLNRLSSVVDALANVV